MGTAILFKAALPLFSLMVGLIFVGKSTPGHVVAPPVHVAPAVERVVPEVEPQELGEEENADEGAEQEAVKE